MKKYVILFCTLAGGMLYAQNQPALTAEQKDNVVLQVWEEKLARDIYMLANTKYAHPVFEHKIKVEESHRDLLTGLLAEKPAVPVAYGEFIDPVWNSRFIELKEKASASFTEALLAGAYIEETDIAGLEQGKILMTDSSAIRIYQVLIEASEQHLRSFLKQLEMQDIVYTPKVLSTDRITTIQAGAGCCAGGKGQNSGNNCGTGCGKGGC